MLKLPKTGRRYFGSAFLTLVLMAWGTPARASEFVVDFVDNRADDNLHIIVYRDGVVIEDVAVGGESLPDVSADLFDNAVLADSFDLSFNIYDADNVTLSDTWHLQGTRGEHTVSVAFFSDVEGQSPQPLPNGMRIIESGGFQTELSHFAINPDGSQSHYVWRFVSERDPAVPEPASLLLLGTGLTGAAWRRRRQAMGASRQK